jgi:Tol biopolymer transport system component
MQEGVALVTKSASGMEREKMIVKNDPINDYVLNSWSPDGQKILCTYQAAGQYSLVLTPATGGTAVPFLTGKGSQANGQISPDGKWAAYGSDESGNWEVYVTSFPGGAGKWQVSRGGGTEPRWRGDSKEIYYLSPNGTLMAVPVSSDASFSTGSPQPLFQIHGRAPISSTDAFTYDVAKDGKRFLVNRYVSPEHVAPLTILLHSDQATSAH